MSFSYAKKDPFELSRVKTLEKMFEKDLEYQWQLDLYKKLWGKDLGNTDPGIQRSVRLVVRRWPRAPNGAVIRQLPPGYATPSSTHLWGERLLDFFCVSRGTDVMAQHDELISTSSRLSAWMKANGEAQFAKDELLWAETEEPPRLRPAADIMEILSARDLLTMMGSSGISLRGEAKSNAEDIDVDKEAKPVVLPFDYKNYPDPWPLVPFSSNPPTLQSPIPFHLLPETLIVHDPYRLLHASQYKAKDAGWTSVNDITHTYKLNLTVDSIEKTIADERERNEKRAGSATPVVVGTLFDRGDKCHPSDPTATVIPGDAYKVTVPPPPPPPISIPEAHLYLTPEHTVGIGNHSRVYRAEWDLPRSVFTKPKICMTCVEEAAKKIIQKTTSTPVDIRDSPHSISNDSDSSPCFNGTLRLREDHQPKLTFAFSKYNFDVAELEKSREQIDENLMHTLEDSKTTTYVEYSGAVSTIHVDTVPWYDPASTAPPPCSHLTQSFVSGSFSGSPPPTAQVSVVAKISLPGDTHLEQEAVIYQRFGMQFSQHWTGYTLANPVHNPTPMGAIAPIFYGYYTKAGASNGYFSPILLLEDCGKPINPSKLDFDDRQECAALILRLHYHGWTQGSFWPRNIVMQHGDHADFPLMKSANDRRFRLIDFGRAKFLGDAKDSTSADQWDKERFDEKNIIGHVLEFEDNII
ncbi:hypothetical protein J3R30DRAFT_3331787 [Lentinula aciculospora]|uniref:Protein kinase domain-containing protein n=1 Tax=Lentinula aciculospora TaxID=153920 RepID=A0A9W9ADE4_9AGAR|nr:hypothetical protein J3R30DRAFT_3331787 [Lentinula aciculospora]